MSIRTQISLRAVLTVLTLLVAANPVAAGRLKPPVEAIQAQYEIAEQDLLDVGIGIFDSGIPEETDEAVLEKQGIFPDVRKSEARFIPYHLARTLGATGNWGAVRVIPAGVNNVDVIVSGEILLSNGKTLIVKVAARDASGRTWFSRKFKAEANPLAYHNEELQIRDPYQGLYNQIANDLLAEREDLTSEKIAQLRRISMLKFAADLAPYAFDEYLSTDKKGRYTIERLPADDDPILNRVDRIRERDYMFVDTLNEYYADFYKRMDQPYFDWRAYSYEEQVALMQLRREARMKKIIGGVLMAGAIFVDPSSTAQRVMRDAAAAGGVMAIKSGLEKGKEAKIHVEALKELAASFDAEIAPLLVDVEGQTLRLSGSAEAQYTAWRELLREIFANETGLPLDPDTGSQLTAGPAED
jgi:hypothetical protein